MCWRRSWDQYFVFGQGFRDQIRTFIAESLKGIVATYLTMIRRVGQHLRTARGRAATALVKAQQRLQQLRPVVARVLAQTRARLLGGDTHVPDKVLSIFEPQTEAIRKGKAGKPPSLANS